MRTVMMLEANSMTVQREKGDPPAKRSGYSGDGWSMEHHFMHMVKRELAREYGINLVKVRAVKDMHMVDDQLPILRPARGKRPKPGMHNICVYHGAYQVRSAAKDYNSGEPVTLDIMPNYYDNAQEV